jgi:hypothetical protein
MEDFDVDYLLDNLKSQVPSHLGHLDTAVNKPFFVSLLNKFYSENNLNDDTRFMSESGWLLLGKGTYNYTDRSMPTTYLGQEIVSLFNSKRPKDQNKAYEFKEDITPKHAREVLNELITINSSIDIYLGSCGVKGMRLEKKQEEGLENVLFYIKKNE